MTSEPQIRVAVHGAAGRVGREVLRAVDGAPDMALTAAIDRIALTDLDSLPADVPYYTTDNARVTAALGWVPKRGIDVVLEDIHTWIHQNIDLLRPVLEAKAA